MKHNKLVLVTGSHRSGTTWVGKVLETVSGARYLQEPFNLEHRSSGNQLPLDFWFQFFDKDSGSAIKAMASMIRERSTGQMAGRLHGIPYSVLSRLEMKLRRAVRREPVVILKDPIALLSSQWLYEQFGARPIVMIRHPAAFVSSLKIKNWLFDFDHLLCQPQVLAELPHADQELMVRANQEWSGDPVRVGAVLWLVLHRWIAKLRVENPEWEFVRLEDLSLDPVNGFRELMERIDLPFSEATKKFILETSSSQDNAYIHNSTPTNNVTRNSRENVDAWKERMSPEEACFVRDVTEPVWKLFYSEDEW